MRQLALFKDLFRKHSIDESPLKDFLDRHGAFVENAQKSFPQLSVEKTNTMLQHLLHNHGLREKVYDVFSAMSNFEHMLGTSRAAVDDWKAKRQVQTSGASFLDHCCAFDRAMVSTQGASFQLFGDEGFQCTLILDEGDGIVSLKGDYRAARHLLVDLQCTRFTAYVTTMLASVVHEALHDFSSTLGLVAVKIDAPTVLSQVDLNLVDLAKGFNILLDKVALADHTKAAAKLFSTGAKQHDAWEQTALADLFCSMLDTMPGQSWSVNLSSLCKAGSDDFMMDAKGDIKQVVRCFAVFSQFVVTMGYMLARCFGSEAVTKEHQLKSELLCALSFARYTAGILLLKLQDPLFKSEAILSAPLAVGVQTIEQWSKIARVLLQRSCFDVLHKVLSSIEVLSLEVEKVTPRHEHILSSDKFSKPLATRHLLQWPSRPALSDKTMRLFQSLAHLQRLQTQWVVAPTLDDTASTKDVLLAIRGGFNAAKASMTIIAAVDVVLEKKGDEQIQQAIILTAAKKDVIPEALFRALEAIVSKAPAAMLNKPKQAQAAVMKAVPITNS